MLYLSDWSAEHLHSGGGSFISLFQKQLYGGAQHLLLRQKSARLLAAQQHIDHAPQSLLVSVVT